MKKILLIGGGGHCISVIDSIEKIGTYEIAGIIDTADKVGNKVGGHPIIGTDDDLETFYSRGITNAFMTLGSIGDTELRRKLFRQCEAHGFSFPVIMDPSAVVASFTTIGNGTYIGKGAIVNREVSIGKNAILNTGCIIEHNCHIGDFVHIAPRGTIAGNVCIGHNTHIGIGATVIEGKTIGNDVFVGASSNVIHNIKHNAKAYGNPCKVVEPR
ncbi:acetyltransferase [Pontibacillus litoralis]|nr:acetyltransferase [Pontibacillus litoralis]